jgi:hypothetical protein
MWKIFVGFVAFALLGLFVVMKGGDKLDMQGEAGGHAPTETASTPAAASATATLSAPVANPAESAASAPASK